MGEPVCGRNLDLQLEEIWKGLQASYQDMAKDVREKYGVELTSVGAFGVSAMMHGYMP